MTWSQLATIVALNIAGAVTPGPDIVLITRLATKSRRHALAAVAGITLGVAWWCSLTVFGAAAVIAAFPDALNAVQVIGGFVLVYMGIGMVRSARATFANPPSTVDEAAESLGSTGNAFRTGLATNLANAKAILFFLAIIAPLLPADVGLGTAFVVILTVVVCSFMVFATIATVVSTERVRRSLLRAGPWIDLGSGIFFTVVAIALIVNGARHFIGG